MTLKIEFELREKDIEYFRSRMKRAHDKAASQDESVVIAAADKLVGDALATDPPDFVRQSIEKLKPVIAMLKDAEWRLEGDDRARVLDALAYFVEPDDLIPDHHPGIGYLDDAIMIELVARDLVEEFKAYADFVKFRATRGGKADPAELERQRLELQRRMRRRRRRGVLYS